MSGKLVKCYNDRFLLYYPNDIGIGRMLNEFFYACLSHHNSGTFKTAFIIHNHLKSIKYSRR